MEENNMNYKWTISNRATITALFTTQNTRLLHHPLFSRIAGSIYRVCEICFKTVYNIIHGFTCFITVS